MSRIRICTAGGVELSKVPDTVKLLPLGRVKSQKGDFVVDEESYRSMQRIFKARGIDIVIDYEHQTLADVEAPAGGWIKELSLGTDAIMAKVEWTPRAQEYLRNKEYRYLSPVVLVRDGDRKAVALSSAALTNTPAINGMFAIVNGADPANIENITDIIQKEGGDKEMDLQKLAKLLGLPETASEEEVLSRISMLVARAREEAETVANKTVLELLGLPENARTEEVTASIVALKQGDAEVRKEILALKEQLQRSDVKELVEGALKTGKISADLVDWATQYALKDAEGFKAFLEKTPVIVPMGRLDTVDAAKPVDCDEKVLKSVGVTEEEVRKYTGQEGKANDVRK